MTIREEILNQIKQFEDEYAADQIEQIFNRRLKEIAEKAWEDGLKTGRPEIISIEQSGDVTKSFAKASLNEFLSSHGLLTEEKI